MDISCLSNASYEDFTYLVNKNILGNKRTNPVLREYCMKELVVRSFSLRLNNHEPLEASDGARIMANEVGVSHLLRFIIIKFVAFYHNSIY